LSEIVELESEQEDLLIQLVEAERRVPRADRDYFVVTRTQNSKLRVGLLHSGWPANHPGVFEGDIDILAEAGLLSMPSNPRDTIFSVAPRGYRYYRDMMLRKGQPLERVQSRVREYVLSEPFRRNYPAAYAKWTQAEEFLWDEESPANHSTIGHLAREAMQAFATALVERFKPLAFDTDKAKVKNRLRAVFHACKSNTGSTESSFLEALGRYWDCVSDLVQRQEHGGQKEGSPLAWPDSRRVVFQVAVVMLEIDATLQSCSYDDEIK
jgi:hypothetical protein